MGLLDAIKDFFGFGDDDEEFSGFDLDNGDYDDSDFSGTPAEWLEAEEYIDNEPTGEYVISFDDMESAINYCSDAPPGILTIKIEYDDDGSEAGYEIYRNPSD